MTDSKSPLFSGLGMLFLCKEGFAKRLKLWNWKHERFDDVEWVQQQSIDKAAETKEPKEQTHHKIVLVDVSESPYVYHKKLGQQGVKKGFGNTKWLIDGKEISLVPTLAIAFPLC